MTERGIELIKRFEGYSPTVYLCPAGYLTIGYGHVVRPEEREMFAKGITMEQAEELLRQDLSKYEKAVISLLQPVAFSLQPQQIDALTSFAYNVGLYALKASTLRRKILRGDLLDAADEFLKWVYAGGRKLQGLVRRRQAERELYLEGVLQ
ncbi:lysozyme [Thermodesulfovibrio sp. 1176]|uniref:lysozyme n=1 Tax=unclassified Thermodesulfovibrio TaxID=2645936 RepID=UPI00083B1CC1|nr:MULTISPECIES: lysozyme [unclassified Thermodesulfovibrio]MDI1471925.1 lysozyme [Thermodesulfovibrio sp. 1176]